MRGPDEAKSDALVLSQRTLADLKKEISSDSKKNFELEREIRQLDQKIALLIRNRLTLDEVMASSGDISLVNRTITLKDKRERELYGQLFGLLQVETRFVSTLARLVKLGEIDNLLQTVMFTLYGNQYDESEEHLLLSMFKSVLFEEFRQSKSIANLLRANTALTRMMTTYTRRGPGQQYLKEVLTKVLTHLTSAQDLILEINPLKVYEAMLNQRESMTGQQSNLNRKPTAEEAAANPDVQEIIQPRIKKLGEIADQFISAFINSIDLVPYGIRWICRQISLLTREMFPTATREQALSLVGGFYLLRFVNPAVVTPQAFMLVEAKLSANARRNLTLLAKILQNLANNIQFGGVKEFYMAPLNTVLENNKPRINDFLEKLTDVDDLEAHLNLDRYVALGKTSENFINISLNEMYFIHGLLNHHLPVIAPEISAPTDELLHRLLRELGPAPPQLPRKDNANVDLKLETQLLGSQGEPEMTPEQIYQETKYLLFSIIKALPDIKGANTTDIPATLQLAQMVAIKSQNEALGEMILNINTNIKDLLAAGLIKEEDGYAQLRKDAMQELLNYEKQVEKTNNDIQLLNKVISNIREHNLFLQQQLEVYKQYLDNVRQNCSSSSPATKKNPEQKGSKKKSSSSSSSGQRKLGPIKFTHNLLEKDGIIIESEVPAERRSSINFSFTSPNPGSFEIEVLYKSRHIADMKLELDDLLERQHNNQLDLELDFLRLNVNLLIYLLNKNFLSSAK